MQSPQNTGSSADGAQSPAIPRSFSVPEMNSAALLPPLAPHTQSSSQPSPPSLSQGAIAATSTHPTSPAIAPRRHSASMATAHHHHHQRQNSTGLYGSSCEADEILVACGKSGVVEFPTSSLGVDYGGVLALATTSPSRPSSAPVDTSPMAAAGHESSSTPTLLANDRSEVTRSGHAETYVIVMVGLPAGGKTFLAKKLCRYLNWQGIPSQLHNIGEKWRALVQNDALSYGAIFSSASESATIAHPTPQQLGASVSSSGGNQTGAANETVAADGSGTSQPNQGARDEPPGTNASVGAQPHHPPELHPIGFTSVEGYENLFDSGLSAPSNAALVNFIPYTEFDLMSHPARIDRYRRVLRNTADHISNYFHGDAHGRVAFVNDNFFVHPQIRAEFVSMLAEVTPATIVIFIEVVQEHDEIRQKYQQSKLLDATEYSSETQRAVALDDFERRIAVLKKGYAPLKFPDRFIRIRDTIHCEMCGVKGFLPSRIAAFVVNLNARDHRVPIYFCRHGQSEYNIEDRLGGNPRLTVKGQGDAQALKEFLREVKTQADAEGRSMEIWTSQLLRTIQTAQPAEVELGLPAVRWRALNELHAGVCENLTYAEVKQKYPLIHQMRARSKYFFRYPEGESYQDLVLRLEEIIVELENTERVIVVVAHQAVLRGLLSYFGARSAEESVHAVVPHRTVWVARATSAGDSCLETISLPGANEAEKD